MVNDSPKTKLNKTENLTKTNEDKQKGEPRKVQALVSQRLQNQSHRYSENIVMQFKKVPQLTCLVTGELAALRSRL